MATAKAKPATVKSMVPAPMLAMRVYYSSYHLYAANHFMQLATDIEDKHTGRSVFNVTHRAYVTSAVLCAVAFLEAAINELYKDAADGEVSYIKPLDPKTRAGLTQIWSKAEGRDMSILPKFQLALILAGVKEFPKDRQPYQDVTLVVRLRNELVHYRPETLSAASISKLEAKLKSKFPPSRLMAASGNPWFPDKCLGAGCALWVTKAVKAFSDAFYQKIGIVPNYQRVKF